jgi:hypothetical protein
VVVAEDESVLPQLIESKFDLIVDDANRSIEFYSILGFSVARAKADGFTTLANGSITVSLSPMPSWLPTH